MKNTALLCVCCILFSLAAFSALQAAEKPLQLTVALEKIDSTVYDGKTYYSAKIRATITNRSGKNCTFYFEDCGICFWQASINGGRYNSIKDARHERPCDFRNTATLQPGKSASKTLHVSLPDFSKEKGVKTIRIRYRDGKEAKDVLESNTLKL